MKVNTLIKYQLKDMKYVFIILYAILIFVNILNFATVTISGNSSSNSGMDVSTSLTFLVVAICCFSETFGMWSQNGVSRKNIFKGFIGSTVVISLICSLADYVITAVSPILFRTQGYFSVISFVFEDYLSQCNIVTAFLIEIMFTILLCAMCMMFGYLIAILFYRGGKIMRIAIPSGIPIFFFGVLPTVGALFYDTAIVKKMIEILLIVLGVKSGNPIYLIATVTVTLLLLCVINYLLIKKTQIRTQS